MRNVERGTQSSLDSRLLLPQLEDCIRCIAASAICIPRCFVSVVSAISVSRGHKISSFSNLRRDVTGAAPISPYSVVRKFNCPNFL